MGFFPYTSGFVIFIRLHNILTLYTIYIYLNTAKCKYDQTMQTDVQQVIYLCAKIVTKLIYKENHWRTTEGQKFALPQQCITYYTLKCQLNIA